MYTPCPNEHEGCRFYETDLGCVANTHHHYWPKFKYTTAVERSFRELPENKEQMCMEEHRELHETTPPPKKPSRDFMLNALQKGIQEVA